MVLSEKNEDKELLYNAMLRLNEEAMALGIARDEVPRLPSKEQINNAVNAVKKTMETFNPYQSKIKRMAPQPRDSATKSATERQLEELQARQKELLSQQRVPCDGERNEYIFARESTKKRKPCSYGAWNQ